MFRAKARRIIRDRGRRASVIKSAENCVKVFQQKIDAFRASTVRVKCRKHMIMDWRDTEEWDTVTESGGDMSELALCESYHTRTQSEITTTVQSQSPRTQSAPTILSDAVPQTDMKVSVISPPQDMKVLSPQTVIIAPRFDHRLDQVNTVREKNMARVNKRWVVNNIDEKDISPDAYCSINNNGFVRICISKFGFTSPTRKIQDLLDKQEIGWQTVTERDAQLQRLFGL
jgi:hypothetical protein